MDITPWNEPFRKDMGYWVGRWTPLTLKFIWTNRGMICVGFAVSIFVLGLMTRFNTPSRFSLSARDSELFKETTKGLKDWKEGAFWERPVIWESKWDNKIFWVMVVGQSDKNTFVDDRGHPVQYRCTKTYALPATRNGTDLYPPSVDPYFLGSMRWQQVAQVCRTDNQTWIWDFMQ